MRTKFSPRELAQAKKPSPVTSRAYKPFLIGAVITTLMKKQGKTEEEIARYMKVTVRCVQYWLTRQYLPIPIMMELSKFFNKNLMAEYHPDVDDPENPLAAVVAKLQKENEELREENADLKEELKDIPRLEGKLEEAEKVISQFRMGAR